MFFIDRAGIAGGDGQTHNGIYDISFLNAMPNMIITQPRDGDMLKDLLESAHAWGLPASIRYPNLETKQTDRPRKFQECGKAEILQKGSQILIICLGHMDKIAFELSDLLQKDEIKPTIVDPIFIKPLDEELFKTLLESHEIVITIEEHSLVSGFGSIFNNFIVRNGFTLS